MMFGEDRCKKCSGIRRIKKEQYNEAMDMDANYGQGDVGNANLIPLDVEASSTDDDDFNQIESDQKSPMKQVVNEQDGSKATSNFNSAESSKAAVAKQLIRTAQLSVFAVLAFIVLCSVQIASDNAYLKKELKRQADQHESFKLELTKMKTEQQDITLNFEKMFNEQLQKLNTDNCQAITSNCAYDIYIGAFPSWLKRTFGSRAGTSNLNSSDTTGPSDENKDEAGSLLNSVEKEADLEKEGDNLESDKSNWKSGGIKLETSVEAEDDEVTTMELDTSEISTENPANDSPVH